MRWVRFAPARGDGVVWRALAGFGARGVSVYGRIRGGAGSLAPARGW